MPAAYTENFTKCNLGTNLTDQNNSISTRFDVRIPFFLSAATVCSMMLSLFLLQLFAGLLSILWLFESIENKKKAFDIFTLLILIFGAVRILSIVLSQFPSDSVQSYYKDALFYFSFFAFSFYLKAMRKDKLEKIVYIFIISAIAISIIGLVLFNLKLVERAQSFSSGYATFSSYLITSLGLYIALPFKEERKYAWQARSIGMALILAGVVTSMGRTNIFIAGLLFIAGLFFKKIKIKPAIVIAVLTVLISLSSFEMNKKEITNRVDNPTTLSDRNIILKGAVDLAFVHPLLGFGPRTFHDIFPYTNLLADKGIGSWHNDFIQVYFESGILGELSFLAIIFMFMVIALKYLKGSPANRILKDVTFGSLLGFAALVLSALTAGFIDSPVLSILFAFLISTLSTAFYFNRSEGEQIVSSHNTKSFHFN